MSTIIDTETRQELQRVLSELMTPVKLLFFTQRNSCPACDQQRARGGVSSELYKKQVLRYNAYKKLSGRQDFIDEFWENK